MRLLTISAAVAAGVMTASSGFAGEAAKDQPSPTVHIFDCGTIEFDDIGFFSDSGEYDGRAGSVIVPCYLINHPAGSLLWDTGLSRTMVDSPDNGTGGIRASIDTTLMEQMAGIGVAAGDVDYIAMSHLHPDHSGNANMFAGTATWLARKTQIEYGFGEDAAALSFDPATYGELKDGPIEIVEGDYDVFGDGSVVIMSAPGHTPGHQVLFVDLAEYGPVVFSGDLQIMRESREKRLVPTFSFDRAMTLKSMDRIEAFITERGARMIIQHSLLDFDALPRSPDVLK